MGICFEKFQLDQIQNDRLSAIIIFNMRDIWPVISGGILINVPGVYLNKNSILVKN